MYRLDDEIIKGGPVDVIAFMRVNAFDPDQWKSLDEYLEFLVSSIWRFHGKGITLEGESLEARCESMVRQLVEHGLLEEIK